MNFQRPHPKIQHYLQKNLLTTDLQLDHLKKKVEEIKHNDEAVAPSQFEVKKNEYVVKT